jgi:hypothetical protein
MSYELTKSEERENRLFYRLDGETAERCGAVGYLRADFGKSGQEFWTTWFDNQKRLKSNGFKEQFNGLIASLRTEIFEDRPAMRLWCGGNYGVSLGERGTGFKIQTADYTYYLRCKPGTGDYDAYLFAYDNRYLLPELAGQHELPKTCFSVLPSSGELIQMWRDKPGYVPFTSPATTEEVRLAANDMNESMGVTRAQEAAMLAGNLFGWRTPSAKPWNYEQDGTPRKPPKRYEPER